MWFALVRNGSVNHGIGAHILHDRPHADSVSAHWTLGKSSVSCTLTRIAGNAGAEQQWGLETLMR
jgi:hypothetical protein